MVGISTPKSFKLRNTTNICSSPAGICMGPCSCIFTGTVEQLFTQKVNRKKNVQTQHKVLCWGKEVKIFGKIHSNKMMKFLLIAYFHGTKSYQSISFSQQRK